MADRKKLIENGKTVLIVLLVISAAFLMHKTGYYSGTLNKVEQLFYSGTEVAGSAAEESADKEESGIVQPREISVSAREGHRYSSVYNKETVEEDYSRFSAFLAEALGSASVARNVDAAQWINALESENVYVRYFAPQSASYLSARLGTELSSAAEAFMAAEFCLSCEDEEVSLYYRTDEGYFACETAVSAAALKERLAEFIPNRSLFSHSDKMLSGIGDSIVVVKDYSTVPEIKSGSVGNGQVYTSLIHALDINEYTASHYTESGGTAVYVDGSGILRIEPSGYAVYELNGESALNASDAGLDSILDFCWSIVSPTVGSSCGSAEIYMSGITRDESGNYSISFDYLVGGIPVWTGGHSAAVFSFSGASLKNAEFYYRAFSQTGQSSELLPMYQAAAIASAEYSGQLSLIYFDTQETTHCVWVNE